MLSDALHAYGEPLPDDAARGAGLRLPVARITRASSRRSSSRRAASSRSPPSSRARSAGPARPRTATCSTSSPSRSAPSWSRSCPADARTLSPARPRARAPRQGAAQGARPRSAWRWRRLVVARRRTASDALPSWFLVEVVRDLPRLVEKRSECPRRSRPDAQDGPGRRGLRGRRARLVAPSPALRPLLQRVTHQPQRGAESLPRDGWAVVTPTGVDPRASQPPGRARGVGLRARALPAPPRLRPSSRARAQPDPWNLACDAFVSRFLADLKLGRRPAEILPWSDLAGGDRGTPSRRALRERGRSATCATAARPVRALPT